MCTFMSTAELPNPSVKGGNNNQNNGNGNSFINLFLKPNNEGEQYCVRLLWYTQPNKNNRNTPYIIQKIHDHWTESNGKKFIDDSVVCPSTKYVKYDQEKFVKNERTGKPEVNCPICRKATEALNACKFSNWKDKAAIKRWNELKAKFRAVVPVYVVEDPNNERNNEHPKCLIFTDQDEFNRFDTLVQEERSRAIIAKNNDGTGYEVFNGVNAVNFYIRMENVKEIRNQGKPNQYEATVRKITQMAFDTPDNASNIKEINKEMVDTFEFDDVYYVSNTSKEIEEFYQKHYGKVSNIAVNRNIFGNNKPATPVVTPVVSAPKEKVAVAPTAAIVPERVVDDVINETPQSEEAPLADMPFDDDTPPSEVDAESIINDMFK